jgi:hypothetical protein
VPGGRLWPPAGRSTPPPTAILYGAERPRRRRRALAVVVIVAVLTSVPLGIGLGRYLVGASAASHGADDPAVGSRHQAMLGLVYELGRPAGFDPLTSVDWGNERLNAYYQVHCTGTGGTCPVDVPNEVADWASEVGDRAFTLDFLRNCPVGGCAAVFQRGRWSVYTLLTRDATTEYPWYTLQISVYPA